MLPKKSRHGNVNVEVSLLVFTLKGDVASAVSWGGGQLTFPWCLPGPGGAPEWRNLRPEGWVETDWWFCWERSWSGEGGWGGWIRSGGPCSWSFSAMVHSWKGLDICSSEMMDGLFDGVRAEWWRRAGTVQGMRDLGSMHLSHHIYWQWSKNVTTISSAHKLCQKCFCCKDWPQFCEEVGIVWLQQKGLKASKDSLTPKIWIQLPILICNIFSVRCEMPVHDGSKTEAKHEYVGMHHTAAQHHSDQVHLTLL